VFDTLSYILTKIDMGRIRSNSTSNKLFKQSVDLCRPLQGYPNFGSLYIYQLRYNNKCAHLLRTKLVYLLIYTYEHVKADIDYLICSKINIYL